MSELEVAQVTRSHGVRGFVKVELHWGASQSIEGSRTLRLRLPSGEVRELRVEQLRPVPKALLVKFAGVDDRDAADALRGARVLVSRDALPPLADGEAYLVDLVGAQVFGPDGLVGEVVEVMVHPTVDTLVIRRPDGRTVEQALVPAFIARLDAGARRIELANLDGLIE